MAAADMRDLNLLLNRVLLGDAICDKSSGSQGCSSTVASSLEEVVIIGVLNSHECPCHTWLKS